MKHLIKLVFLCILIPFYMHGQTQEVVVDGIRYMPLDEIDSQYDERVAYVLRSDNPSGYEGDLYVPDYITYDDNRYRVVIFSSGSADIYDITPFQGCANLKSVSLPSSLIEIKGFMFDQCESLESVEFRSELKLLGFRSFYNCFNLKEIKMPSSVTEIGEWCFSSCHSLKQITLPISLQSIGREAFTDCISLDSVEFLSTNIHSLPVQCFYNTNIETLKLPNSIKGLETLCFGNCLNLKSVEFSDSFESIGDGCFAGCSKLDNINFPSSLNNIGNHAFASCSSLKDISFPLNIKELPIGCFERCTSIQSIIIPENIEYIGAYCFEKCDNLENIVLSEGVRYIGDRCFYSCENLENIVLSEGVGYIGDRCFYSCENLEYISLPNSLIELGNNCFEECKKLEKITLPKSLDFIPPFCFANCINLKSVYADNSMLKIGECAFNLCSNLENINFSIDKLDVGSFNYCSKLQKISLSANVSYIPDLCFCRCYGLQEINSECSSLKLGIGCFSECNELSKLDFQIAGLDDSSFYGCQKLKEIDLSDDIDEIPSSCFAYCVELSKIKFPKSLRRIREGAFLRCAFLSIEIPASVQLIEGFGFGECEKLFHLIVEKSNAKLTIEENAFSSCPELFVLKIDRNINATNQWVDSSNISALILGCNVTDARWFDSKLASNLIQITSMAINPPKVNEFTDEQYANVILTLPEEGVKNYENDINWAFFNNWQGLKNSIDDFKIEINPNEASINVGESIMYDYTINSPNETFPESYVIMSISDSNCVRFVDFGILEGVAIGDVTVSMTLLINGSSDSALLHVVQPAIDIVLSRTSLKLNVGEVTNIFARISPQDVSDSSITWESSNPEIAIVEDGEVTAIAGGECDIIATTHNGLTATCHVKVIQNPESITFNTNELTIEVGNSSKLEVEFSPSTTTERNVTWSSSDADVASVEDGTVTAKKAGEAIITATTENGLTVECTVIVTQIVTKIEISSKESSVFVGESIQLTAAMFPEDATDKSITWKSSDESIAIVDENGTVTGMAPGACEITATAANGVSASCSIKVKQYAAEIKLSKESTVMFVGDSETLAVEFTPESTTEKDLTWISSNSEVASVSDGVVTALKGGNATITATTVNGLTASCEVTVIQPVEAIELNVQSSEIFIDDTIQLTATLYPADATYKNVTWSSSDEVVATVDNDGLVKGVSAGRCEIIATSNNGLTARCTITVKQMADEIFLTPEDVEIHIGESFPLEVSFRPESTTERNLTWQSSDESIALVSNGNVTGVGIGEAVITASTDYGLTATCNVSVLPIPAESIELNLYEVDVEEGSQIQLTATVYPANATDKRIIWSSDDESIAAVDSNGLVTVLKEGTALITATAADESGASASCRINGLSDIEAIFAETDNCDVYSLDGLLVRKGATRSNLDALAPGVYILRSAGRTLKVTVTR